MKAFEKQLFLLGEDEEGEAELLKEAFARAGITNPLVVMGDGQEIINFFENREDPASHPKPIVLLLDLKLPGKNGFEVLKWVRCQPGLKRLLVIILTSSSRTADADFAYELGANFFLRKPVEFKALVEMARCLGDWLRLNNFAEDAGSGALALNKKPSFLEGKMPLT